MKVIPKIALLMTRMATVLALMLAAMAVPRVANAEEPYQRFLQRLRDEQLYDLALIYLEDLIKQPNVSDEFKADFDLERGILLYQSAAVLSARSPARAAKLDSAEVALRKFLDEKKNHKRRGETRLKLGELLLTRAEESKASFSGEAGAEVAAAVAFYNEAHELFENTIQELGGILSQLEGNRVDPKDAPRIAYRQKVRQDARQAQLLSAKAVEERGRARASDSPERIKDLEQALAMYTALYSKEQQMIGIRNYALFYRSGVHATLGKSIDAIDGFQRIADLEGVDVLRPLQTSAITELIKLLAAEGKYPLAVDRATQWMSDLRPDERGSAETVELQLELARVRMAWSEILKEKDPKDRTAGRLLDDARSDLRVLLRIVGPHLDETRELLAEMGVGPAAANTKSAEIPKVKDFSEALAEAQKRLDQADTMSIDLAVQEEKIADPNLSEEEKKAATDALQATQQAVDETREQSLQLLREGLRLFNAEDDRDQLFEARFRVAFLLLKLQRAWDAMVVGDFLARTNPGTERGLRAAAVTLASFSTLLNDAGDDKSSVTSQLEPFAEYLVATWPQSSEAAAAAAALAQLSIIDKDWEKAEKYLNLVPSSNETASKRRDLGISLYVEYLQAKRLAGEETEAVGQLRERAIKWLELATAEVGPDSFDSSTIDAVNALSRLLIAGQRIEDAAKLLFDDTRGLIKTLEAKPGVAEPRTAMDAYRTAIQVSAAQLVAGGIDSDVAVSQMQTYVAKLQELAQATAGGEEVLGGIFLALAKDLKEKLAETKDVAKRNRLADAVLLVVGEAGKSESFNTQYWAASTKTEIAKELASDPSGREKANKAFAEGAAILTRILAKEESTPGWIQPAAAKTQVRISLSRAQSGMGDHQSAVLGLGEILDENNGLLDVQIEAAEILTAWGAKSPPRYRDAIMGGRRKAGSNVIWGWGKIAQMTNNQPNFSEQFYDARYQLAKSRFLFAKTIANAEQRTDEIRRAEKDITSTAALYPELGGEAKKKEFDALLRIIQKELGQPATGLAAANKK